MCDIINSYDSEDKQENLDSFCEKIHDEGNDMRDEIMHLYKGETQILGHKFCGTRTRIKNSRSRLVKYARTDKKGQIGPKIWAWQSWHT